MKLSVIAIETYKTNQYDLLKKIRKDLNRAGREEMLDASGVIELNGCSQRLFRYLKMIIFETADPRGFLFMEERRCSAEARTPPGSARPKREGIGEEHEPSVGSQRPPQKRSQLAPSSASRARGQSGPGPAFGWSLQTGPWLLGHKGAAAARVIWQRPWVDCCPRGGLFLQAAQDQRDGGPGRHILAGSYCIMIQKNPLVRREETHLQRLNPPGVL